jgi:stage V sporulation protein R
MTVGMHDGLWRNAHYTMDDLAALEERCLEEAHALGLRPPPVAFHLVPAEVVYDVASRGLPGRYSHWRFGQAYEQMKSDYDSGRSRIYELVVNTRPAHAYLLEGNSLVAQLLVIAHVLGHAVVFEQSRYFVPADKGFLPRVRAGAARIDEYMTAHGRTAVEDFVDDCEALASTLPLAQLGTSFVDDTPTFTPQQFDELFPDETAARRDRAERERAEMRVRFPRHPERDILGFLMTHARGLDDWQRDVLGIVREEQRYFAPQMQSKIVHEGMATWTHNAILQRLGLDSADFVEYQRLNASVTQPHPFRLNPYNVGWEIFKEIERIATDPDDDERERWAWAGGGDPVARILEIVEAYDDVSLVSEFLTPKVCERAKLYAWEHEAADPRRLVISSREADEIRRSLLAGIVNGGLPVVEIVDGDHLGRGELLLAHRAEGTGLDQEYAKGTLVHLATIWGKPVTISSVVEEQKPVWYRATPGSTEVETASEPPAV